MCYNIQKGKEQHTKRSPFSPHGPVALPKATILTSLSLCIYCMRYCVT